MYQEWNAQKNDPSAVERLCRDLRVSPLTASVLLNRGLGESKKAASFLNPQLTDLHDPMLLTDMDKAVNRIHEAILGNQHVTIYGDFDVDGVSATTVLYKLFKEIGQTVDYYIPNRLDGIYGMYPESVRDIASRGTKLIITVDCGVNNTEAVKAAQECGVDVIITDHHEVEDGPLPPAVAVINPKRKDCKYPFKELAGVGVAFKLAWAISKHLSSSDRVFTKYRDFLTEMLGVVALGTIADVVPLLEENRIFAAWGLKSMPTAGNIGIHALIESCQLRNRDITAGDVAFRLGPMLNAAGRLGDASLGVELLTTSSFENAIRIAVELEKKNHERQERGAQTLEEARELAFKQVAQQGSKCLVLAKEGWHQGVIGIVAARLVEEFHCPTVLISVEHGVGRGSARSIPDINLYDMLKKCEDLFSSFGGHDCAAGLNIAAENVPTFVERFTKIAEYTLNERHLLKSLTIDAEANLNQLSFEVARELNRMEPFGHANPKPVFRANGVSIGGKPKPIGKKGNHLTFYIKQGNASLRAVAFGMADQLERLATRGMTFDIAFTPYINNFRGTDSLEVQILDLRTAETTAPATVATTL